ncbi:MAG: hypothetical protein Q8O88_04710 [bacterium]|nr:hypothetical protein [bacterium]
MYYPDCLDCENNIEDICYRQDHIDKVWEEIKQVIPTYFQKYIETENGSAVQDSEVEKLMEKFGSTARPKNKIKDPKKILERLLKESIQSYESDRDAYKEILHRESFEEYKYDVNAFKNTILKNQVPVIRRTLQNKKAKELDKFRAAFNASQAGDLFTIASNIVELANDWRNNWYNGQIFESINTTEDLGYFDFDGEDYTAFGVIGGGIKSQFVYKLYPEMFPSRSREAVWALYYLSNKKHFGCKQDSPFLMINAKEGTTQQNYFYPYGIFSLYALRIFNLLKELYAKNGISLLTEYRFVPVDAFLSFVSRSHQSEIDVLKQKSVSKKNYHYD